MALATLLWGATPAWAQSSLPSHAVEPPPIQAVRLLPGEVINMDGSLSASAWQRAPVFSKFVQHQPQRGAAPAVESRVQVMFDDQALYVGLTAIDPEPAKLRAHWVRHDQVFRTQDFLVVYIDAMGRKQSAQFYRVNATGITGDGLHTASDDSEDFSPDHDYEAAAKKTDNGYTAVMRIPYSGLRFSPTGALPWRIMVGRRTPRDQVALDLSVPLAQDATSFIANLQRLDGFEPPASAQFLQVRPTLTARKGQDNAGGATVRESQFKASMDVKYRPSAQWVLDASINPDFSQVALDVPQLSRNSRFALFLSEKRPVFLESRDLLSSPTDALYTRAVHDPRWVARASLRGNSVSATSLVASDKGGGLTLLPGTYGSGAALTPANSSAMTRVTRDGEGVTLGALGSVRQFEQGSHAHLAVDWRADLASGWRTSGQVGASRTTAWANSQGRLIEGAAQNGHRTVLRLNRSANAWEVSASLDQSSPDFRNDLGFVNQVGVRVLAGEVKHKFEGLSLGPVKTNELHVFLMGQHVADRGLGPSRGQTVSGWLTPGVWMQTQMGFDAAVQWRGLSIARSEGTAPLLREKYLHASMSATPGNRVSLVDISVSAGQLADFAANTTRPGLRWGLFARTRPHARLELEPRLDHLKLQQSGNATALQETAAQLLGVWHLMPRHSLRVIAQNGRYRRAADPANGLAAEQSSRNAQSVTYIWRQSNAQALYAGLARGAQGASATPTTQGTELFLKAQFELGG